jgi:hypothetical protein
MKTNNTDSSKGGRDGAISTKHSDSSQSETSSPVTHVALSTPGTINEQIQNAMYAPLDVRTSNLQYDVLQLARKLNEVIDLLNTSSKPSRGHSDD